MNHKSRHLSRIFWWGVALSGVIIVLGLFAPVLAPFDPWKVTGQPFELPSLIHLLGTNDAGQDILSEFLYGCRTSLSISLSVVALSTAIALFVGVTAGIFPHFDWIIMRLIDAFLAVPALLLFLLVSVHFSLSETRLILLLSLVFWTHPARMIRSQILSTRNRKYIEAAKGFGANTVYITFRHIVPEVFPILFTGFLTRLRMAVFIEAGLAFLGISDPTMKSWGTMLHFASRYLYLNRWANWILPVAASIFCVILGYTLMGNAFQNILIRSEK